MAHTVIGTYEDYFKLPEINFKLKYGENRYYEIERFVGSFDFLESMELTLYRKARILNTSEAVYVRHLEAYKEVKSTQESTEQSNNSDNEAPTNVNKNLI